MGTGEIAGTNIGRVYMRRVKIDRRPFGRVGPGDRLASYSRSSLAHCIQWTGSGGAASPAASCTGSDIGQGWRGHRGCRVKRLFLHGELMTSSPNEGFSVAGYGVFAARGRCRCRRSWDAGRAPGERGSTGLHPGRTPPSIHGPTGAVRSRIAAGARGRSQARTSSLQSRGSAPLRGCRSGASRATDDRGDVNIEPLSGGGQGHPRPKVWFVTAKPQMQERTHLGSIPPPNPPRVGAALFVRSIPRDKKRLWYVEVDDFESPVSPELRQKQTLTIPKTGNQA